MVFKRNEFYKAIDKPDIVSQTICSVVFQFYGKLIIILYSGSLFASFQLPVSYLRFSCAYDE